MKIKDAYHLVEIGPEVVTRDFITGCEYEIEEILSLGGLNMDVVSVVEDPSLRNNGREFTTPPLNFEGQLFYFEHIHEELKLGKNPYSDRTSIHVHVNVRELTVDEVKQFVLTYALLEPLFFEYVGEVRKGSIYCVPLNYTYLPSIYKYNLQTLHSKWHKYTAFNILPLSEYGTVEFRHMYGTGNLETFKFWLGCLKELYTFIESTQGFDILSVISDESFSVVEFAKKVVPSLAVGSDERLLSLLEDTLLDVKLSAGGLK